ncbi:hypothetical protein C8A01DRAFT_17021 [Parachaetomium inaequale]|uniref:MYB transcription factor n=1 Tax=Parachaetomium inaequale TaxID=2588326 RepID=A0AAN6PH73_9PEZI|nr:hypothetical protein C8A01DRAFT_17021 [Parachaetomium inaequale]
MPSHTSESPAKKQSKWSPEEDALIIELRGSGMKWDDISKRLPGRSSISCRLHYQNYLERRSEWDEERKNKLARLYERFKPEMWAKVAEEMQVPWRAAEAMHWQLGEIEMARRAGVVPFSLNMTSNEPQGPMMQRISPTRGHAHSQSQGSVPRDFSGLPSPRYTRGPPGPGPPPPQIPPMIPPPTPTSAGSGGGGVSRPLSSRRESLTRGPPFGPPLSELTADYGYGLAPIQTTALSGSHSHSHGRPSSEARHNSISGGMLLPSVAELTTGVSPYNTPAYTLGGPQQQQHSVTSPIHSSATASPGPGSGGAPGSSGGGGALLPALSPYPQPPPSLEPTAGKRRASPPDHHLGSRRETSRRRQHLYPSSTRGGGGGTATTGRDEYPPTPPPPPPPSHPSQQQQQQLPFGMGMGGALGMTGPSAVAPARRGAGHGS